MGEVNGQLRELVAAGRAAASRLMVDSCRITTPGARSFNATTGQSSTAATNVYEGPCRVRREPAAGEDEEDVGARQASIRDYRVAIPASVTSVTVGDTVEVTASATDSSQIGLRLVVLDAEHGTTITTRRLRCQEVTS